MDKLYISEKKSIYQGIGDLHLLLVLPVMLFLLAFIVGTPKEIWQGLIKIVLSPAVLITDFISIGGLGATFINVALISFINIYILKKTKTHINGGVIAAFFTIMGFAFFGENIFNIWAIYLGGVLHARYHHVHYRSIILSLMMGTGLSPFISIVAFYFELPLLISFPLSYLVGIAIGFVLPTIASSLLRAHDGYNLYNVGFSGSILALIAVSILRAFNINIVEASNNVANQYDGILLLVFAIFFIFLLLLGLYINYNSGNKYSSIFAFPGRLVTDFTMLVGFGITYINMGLMGLISLVYVHLVGGRLNGPVMGGVLAVVGFSAFGKHPKNTIPIFIGVALANLLNIWDHDATTQVMAGLFGTTLAPIAGAFGILPGIIAGFVHSAVVMNVGYLHAGVALHNNGLAGGLVAAVLVPIFRSFNKDRRDI